MKRWRRHGNRRGHITQPCTACGKHTATGCFVCTQPFCVTCMAVCAGCQRPVCGADAPSGACAVCTAPRPNPRRGFGDTPDWMLPDLLEAKDPVYRIAAACDACHGWIETTTPISR